MASERRGFGGALTDRKGVTSIEYAMIAAGAATVVATCYQVFYTRIAAMLSAISI